MTTEKLELWHYNRESATVEVEYRPTLHWNTDSGFKAYEVVVDGEVIGKVEQVRANTTRPIKGTMLVSRQKGTIEWSWFNKKTGKRNYSGLYGRTRRDAVAEMLGYSTAKKVN